MRYLEVSFLNLFFNFMKFYKGNSILDMHFAAFDSSDPSMSWRLWRRGKPMLSTESYSNMPYVPM
jgi:hypothetical protein